MLLSTAQNASIQGIVTNKDHKDGLVGVNIVIDGTIFGTISGIHGDYLLKNIPAGKQTIIFSFIGYAFFAMAFSIGALYLLQTRLKSNMLPDLQTLRRINEEAVFLGFSLFTLCMIAGSIWAHIAWGHWFSWNIKSVWSVLVWMFYAGMCHAKFIRRWQGGVYAWLSIAGFGVVLFTYLGIGLLLESNHPLE